MLVKYFTNNLSEKHYAIDGKTLRGTKHEGIRALHFLNVYAAESGITLFGKVIDSKKNEITSIPEAIECLDIVMLIGLGDKEHNDCKLSFPRRRESRYLLSQV